jgi:hypothetical protein
MLGTSLIDGPESEQLCCTKVIRRGPQSPAYGPLTDDRADILSADLASLAERKSSVDPWAVRVPS